MPSNKPQLRVLVFRLLIPILLIGFSCRKDFSLEKMGLDIPIDNSIKVKASIQGIIYDETGLPVIGASVKTGASTTLTNETGAFFFNDIETSANLTVLAIEKDGYFSQYKSTVVAEGTDNFIKAQLLKKTLSGSFDVTTGGTVKLSSGALLNITPNAVVSAGNGRPYTGKVNVYMYWMDPSKQTVLNSMPGDLRGLNENGQERMLITYGMMNVELESADGQKLQMDSTKPASLEFPVPTTMQGSAPANVPMWHFDTKKGIWINDGMASLAGNVYKTSVKHFSCWNVDVPYTEPLIDFCVYILDEKKKPYLNAHVLVRREEDRWGAHGYTNCDGYVCGKIPANTPLILEILGEEECEGKLVGVKIGPYTKKVKGDTIILEKKLEQTVTVSGKAVDCDGKPVTKGYIQANIKGAGYIGRVRNGKFEFTLTKCADSKTLDVFGVDEKNGRLSDPKTLAITGKEMDLGTITICGDPNKTTTMGLMGYYPLDGNANDLAVSPVNGTLIGGPAFVADRKGNAGKAVSFLPAVPFDSTKPQVPAKAGQFVDIPGSANRNYLPITVSFWCKLDADAPIHGNILNKYVPAAWNGIQLLYEKNTATGKYFLYPWYLNSQSNRIIGDYGEAPFNFELPTNKWMHIVMTVNDKEAAVYLDNKLVGQKKWTGTARVSTNGFNWKIGGTYDYNNWFKGAMDEVRIYNRVLLASEIKHLFEN